MFNWFTTKNPTIKDDAIAYTAGGSKEFSEDYNTYITSVETLDKALRVISNVASMAKIEVMKDVSGTLKPLKIKNVDLEFNINEVDSQSDFLRKTFSSIFTQGASIIIAEKSKKTGFVSFYPYNPARFAIEASESAVLNNFIYTSQSGKDVEFKPEDIIYTNSTIDITNLVYAVSRLKPLNDMLVLQANIMKQTSDYYSTGSKDSVIISPKEPMSIDNANLLKETFNTFIQSRQTRALFLNSEVDVQSVSNSQTPTDIMNALKDINNTIVQSFGIPTYLFGDYTGYVNDAAIVTASRLFFEIQLKPIFNSLGHQMTKYFRETLKLKNAIITFNFDDIEILQDNLTMKIDNASKLYKLGLLSINEARVECELEPLGDAAADLHMLPAYLTGSAPVPIEKYEELLASGFFDESSGGSEADGTGASGGEDNETELTNEETGTEPEE